MVAMGMTLVPEKRELFGEMSVEDNLLLGAFMRRRLGHRDERETMAEVYRDLSAAEGAAPASRPARCRAASGRCWRSVGR